MKYRKIPASTIIGFLLAGAASLASGAYLAVCGTASLRGVDFGDPAAKTAVSFILCCSAVAWGILLYREACGRTVQKVLIGVTLFEAAAVLTAPFLILFTAVPDHFICFGTCAMLPVLLIINILLFTGTIRTSLDCREMIVNSTLPLRVLNMDGNVVCESKIAKPFTNVQRSSILENRRRLWNSRNRTDETAVFPIRSGWFLEEKDLRDLQALQNELSEAEAKLTQDRKLLQQYDAFTAEIVDIRNEMPLYEAHIDYAASLLEEAGSLLEAASLPDAEPNPAKRYLAEARVFIGCAAGFSAFFRNRTRYLAPAAYSELLKPLLHNAGALGIDESVMAVTDGYCPYNSFVSLYRIHCDLILRSIREHWTEINFRFRNDADQLRSVCTITGIGEEQLPELIRQYREFLPSGVGELSFGPEDGKISLYITLLGRVDTTEPVKDQEIDIRKLLNIPLSKDERHTEPSLTTEDLQ